MQAGPLRRQMITLSVCVLAAQAVVIALVVGRTRPLADLQDQLSRSHTIRGELFALQGAIVSAETGQRGFILTGFEEFLQPYRASVSTLEPRLSQLRALAGPDPVLRQAIDSLSPLIVARQSYMARSIELRRLNEREQAGRLVADGAERDTMDQIRAQLTELIETEQRRIASREQERSRARSIIVHLAFFGLYGTWLLIATLALFIYYRLNAFGAGVSRRVSTAVAPLTEAAAMSERNRKELSALGDSHALARAESQAALEIVTRMTRDLTGLALEITSCTRAISEACADSAAAPQAESGRLLKLAARMAQITLSIELTTTEQRRLLEAEHSLVPRIEDRAKDAARIAELIVQAKQSLVEPAEPPRAASTPVQAGSGEPKDPGTSPAAPPLETSADELRR